MTAVENHDVAEVVQTLGVTPGVIYVSRSRVMKRLREIVEQYSDVAGYTASNQPGEDDGRSRHEV
jgi:hypothetical protein